MAPAALAQGSARIEGIVSDTSGAAVPGATVTATSVRTNAARSVVTSPEGGYVITPLPVGEYRVQVRDTFNATPEKPRYFYRLNVRKEAPDFRLAER